MKFGYHGKHESPKKKFIYSRGFKALICIPLLATIASFAKNTITSAEYGAEIVEVRVENGFGEYLETDDENSIEDINQDSDTELNEKEFRLEKNTNQSRAIKKKFLEDPFDIVEEIIPKVSIAYPDIEAKFFSKEIEEATHELTREEKLQIIEEVHQISEFEYYQIVSTAAHEGGEENYEECYDVVCVAYNRTLSKAWCWSCKQETGKDGTNIIDQIRWIGQFSGFLPKEAGYDQEKYEGTEADKATMDFLFSLVRSNDFLCFCAPWYDRRPSSAVQLHPENRGNAYYRLLKEDDYNDKAIEENTKVLEKTHMH